VPTPEATLTEMILAYRLSQLIYVTARLGIADLLADGPRSSEELAALTGAHPKALYRVLRALASNGIFAETEDRAFALTPLAAPLRAGVAGSLRGVALMQIHEARWQAWGELSYSVKTGRSAFEHVHGMSYWEYIAQHPDVFEAFNTGMADLTRQAIPAIVDAYDFTGCGRIVDVGAGRGDLLAALLARYPYLHGVIVELPALMEEARNVLEVAGVAARCELVAGDYLASLPRGGDVYLLKSIIHGLDESRAVRVLRNCLESLAHGGRVLVIQVIVPSGNARAGIKTGDILHLVSGVGQERTESEYRALFDAAGLRLVRVYPTTSSFSILEGVPT